MGENKRNSSIKIFVTVTFLAMVIVNALANIIPINGQGTGQVSDSYPNLFAPEGITFIIWGLIYLLLGFYTLYQLVFFQRDKGQIKVNLLDKIGFYFIISSIANGTWIIAWHYHLIPVSMILMIIILICLIMINQEVNKEEFTTKEMFFIRLPFSVYFGWITVATIANVTTLLVSLGWDRFGIEETIWTILIIIVGMIIGCAIIIKNSDIAYGLVLIWAYAGIFIKHTSASGFAGQFPGVIITVIVCIIFFMIAGAYILFKKERC